MTTPAMVAIKNISKIIYQTCGPNIPIILLTHPNISHPSLPLRKKIKRKLRVATKIGSTFFGF
jgi:hypothetical protein